LNEIVFFLFLSDVDFYLFIYLFQFSQFVHKIIINTTFNEIVCLTEGSLTGAVHFDSELKLMLIEFIKFESNDWNGFRLTISTLHLNTVGYWIITNHSISCAKLKHKFVLWYLFLFYRRHTVCFGRMFCSTWLLPEANN
jgi:hypothetical protein